MTGNRKSPKPRVKWIDLDAATSRQFDLGVHFREVPILVSEPEPPPIGSTKVVEWSERELLSGLLYRLEETAERFSRFDIDAGIAESDALIRALAGRLGYEGLESAVLDLADDLRAKLGVWVSMKILQNGYMLIPRSTQIATALIPDLWRIACEERDRDFLFEIPTMVREVESGILSDHQLEVISYYAACSCLFEDDDPAAIEFLPNITTERLRERIKYFAEDTIERPCDFEDLDII